MRETCLAIIPARGGSRRIPGKNIKEFCGKSIIAYSIEAALGTGIFDEIMVSTDDEGIADVARKYGAKVPFMRSKETADDHATTADVLLEVINRYKDNGVVYEYGCCIYATAPFLTSDILRDAFDTFKGSNAKTLLPVVAFSFPPQRGVFIRDGRLALSQPEYLNVRSQDIERMYHDCGSFSMFRIGEFINERKLITDNTIPYIMDEIAVQDIDNISDWEMAELKYEILRNKQGKLK